MNINTLKTKKEDNEIQVNRTTLEDIFNRELEIGKYKFRLKKLRAKIYLLLLPNLDFQIRQILLVNSMVKIFQN